MGGNTRISSGRGNRIDFFLVDWGWVEIGAGGIRFGKKMGWRERVNKEIDD